MKEAAPTPNHRWDHLLKNCKAHRLEIRNNLSMPFTRLNLVNNKKGCKLYALGTIHPQPNQTLLAADVRKGNIILHPVFDIDNHKTSVPNQDFTLMLERQRLSQVTGVNDYYVDNASGTVLVTTGEKLFRLKADMNNIISPSDCSSNQERKGEYILDAKLCPCNPQIFSYVTDRKVHIENQSGLLYSTAKEKDIYNGTASFIEQEELDRFDATWWSPTEQRLLYEVVDDSNVKTLNFSCPGKEDSAPMKYPLAGTANSRCTLRLIVVYENQVEDYSLRRPLQEFFPWIEYIARAGFLNDGKTMWVQAFDRQQKHAALIVVPESQFGLDINGPFSEPTIIYEEFSKHWINTCNSIIPLDDNSKSLDIPFIYGSERNNQCQLFLVGVEMNNHNVIRNILKPITPVEFSVCKSAQSIVDLERGLVYYVASPQNCTEMAICASDYFFDTPNFKQLSPPNSSFKGERSYHRLALTPDVGFICYTTAYNQPPSCHFFALRHYNMLPDAELVGSVTLHNPLSDVKSPAVDINDLPHYFKFKSSNSGFEHVGMVLMPPRHDPSKKYPVVHYVYGGPGIQIVKNDYTSWISYQKYTKAGYAVVMIDGRGSANRGSTFESSLQFNLGQSEVEDQVEGLQELAKLMDGRLDLERVVVHGWSYGGFMSLHMLARYPDVYRGAIAGGAVVDWKLYDTAYTERYLGYPINESYEKSSFLKYVDKLPDEPGRLLIVHGFVDENVHFRHTEALIEALLKEGKPYQLQIFPNERHGIRSVDGANHLDATILYFIQTVLRVPIYDY